MATEIEKQLITLIGKGLCKEESELNLTNQTKFVDLGMDSLDCYELIMEIEDTYDISIANVHEMRNLGDLVKVVEKELKK